MKISKMVLAAVTFVLLSGPLSAHANIIYNWIGDCQRILFGSNTLCTHATLHVVTTDDYIPGEVFTPHFPNPNVPPVLLEFLYTDDNGVTIDEAPIWLSDSGNFLLPDIPVGSSLPGEGSFLTTAQFFRSNVNGVWRFEGEELSPGCDPGNPPPGNPFCGYGVIGNNGVWTRVPAPSTLVLLGVGLAGLAFYRRRKVS